MMRALDSILRRPRAVLAMMLFLVFSGVYSYVAIPKDARPDIVVPTYYISIPLEGVSPEDAERLLLKPMEEKLRGLEGLKELTSIASLGHGAIIVEFETDVDTETASQDVREKVDQAKADLPSDAKEPTINEVNFNLFPTLIVALSGDVPERTLYRHARALQDELEAIPSVLEAKLNGEREELLEVIIDTKRLESYQITQQELFNTVSRNNKLVAAGTFDGGRGRFSIKVPGLIEKARDIYELPIKEVDGTVVTLSQLADIRRSFKDRSTYARFNGRPAITISVVKRTGENIIATNDKVREAADKLRKNWPSAIHVDYALDESRNIRETFSSLQSAIITAIALVMIVCVAALGMRSALLVGVAIPTSFMIGFLIVFMSGRSVDNMLMFGMVLTVGMLVDGAIVIVEYADRKMAEGLVRLEAYIQAAKRMFWPIVSSTATTLAAFLPMLFWPGVPGKFMSNLPTTVVIVLTASLLTAMILLPVLGSMFGKTVQEDTTASKALAGDQQTDLSKLGGFTGLYAKALAAMVRAPFVVTVVAFLGMAAIINVYKTNNNGVTFFVDTEPTQSLLYVRGRGNLSAAEKLSIVREVEDVILKVEGVEDVATQAGSGGGGGPELGAGLDVPKDSIGQITIEFLPFAKRRPGDEIIKEIRQKVSHIAGVIIEVRKREGGPQTGKDIRLQVRSHDRALANSTARRVRQHMENNMTGLVDIEDETPLPGIEWNLKINREEAGRFGADIVSVGALITMITDGVLIGTFRPDDSRDEVDIRARLPESQRALSRLEDLRLPTEKGLVPIRNFVEREARPSVDSIIRKDGRTSVFVKANTIQGVLADDKVKELSSWLESQNWPANVEFKFRGSDEEQKESFQFLMKAVAASIFIMFMILVTQFNSFYYTAITLSTVVMSVIGVLIGMLVTGQSFSVIMTGTGIVALAGIVVNNSIVLIDTFQHLRSRGLEVVDAVLRACAQRLRPVLLTTITTIFGLLPMMYQVNVDWFAPAISIGSVTSTWWVQLSTAIIFGLGFSTMLTLILTPVWIAAPELYRTRWHNLRARMAKRKGAVALASGDENAGKTGRGRSNSGDTNAPSNPGATPLPDAAE
ncbi:MAG: efflux RND transporter permease subunit [Alphaproteobacteria bacterium]|nr:efflux RND transporter permease subunit [Alphaproteobacteria bacterium]